MVIFLKCLAFNLYNFIIKNFFLRTDLHSFFQITKENFKEINYLINNLKYLIRRRH